jgi:hypothetical protein
MGIWKIENGLSSVDQLSLMLPAFLVALSTDAGVEIAGYKHVLEWVERFKTIPGFHVCPAYVGVRRRSESARAG